MTKPAYLGIDLGTTNSVAAVFDGDKVDIIRNAHGAVLTPSVVRLDARGSATVGSKARRLLDSDPSNTHSEFKRLMGSGQQVNFAAAKVTRRPEELSALLLKSLRVDTQDQCGFEPMSAVVTVPALFELPQNSATSEAARLAGFERVELLQEPVASALAAGWSADDTSGSWLVYDLGGGTFDASLLETREGLLRVVGHDGDNFLGGRDIDNALVDWVLAELARREGITVSRANPAHLLGLRQLRLAAEEAKIELSRSSAADLYLPGLFVVAGAPVDIELSLTRSTFEALLSPLVERSIKVCLRLLASNGLAAGALSRIVLVGGPTVIPSLRERVCAALGAPAGVNLDPMTLVAQGAAIYAATVNLEARRAVTSSGIGRKAWLQYPAMTSDLNPHVVGRVVAGPGPLPETIVFRRGTDGWQSAPATVDEEGAFVASIELEARRSSSFSIDARSRDGAPVPLDPASITVLHGLTVGDPPLSRSVGIALANDRVQVYVERGAPLPAKRRFTLKTVETVAKGAHGSLLRIPIVQGEFQVAHLCRLVGTLDISSAGVNATLPVGSAVEVTIELDRGGRLGARAYVPALDQIFEEVAHLLAPDVPVERLQQTFDQLSVRVDAVRTAAFREGRARHISKLSGIEQELALIKGQIDAAVGGDQDAAQMARRSMLDMDAQLEELESEKRWPEVLAEARERYGAAASWVSRYGSASEQSMLEDAWQGVENACAQQDAPMVERHLRIIHQLRSAAYFRNPTAWSDEFDAVASRLDEATDLPRAQKLVASGCHAKATGDQAAVKRVVQQLWEQMPAASRDRKLGFDSGVW